MKSRLSRNNGGEIMVAVKARISAQPSDVALIETINRVEKNLREAFPQVRWIFFEPDLRD